MAELNSTGRFYLDATIEPIVCALKRARHVVVVTGSGVSAASGIPTFRDALDGVWAKFDPTELATFQAFKANPQRVSRWYEHRRLQCLACRPNAAHVALAQLEQHLVQRGGALTLLTQNVDRLHQRAGSACVHELHGSLFRWACIRCRREVEFLTPESEEAGARACEHCGGMLRPGVVWFGEMLPMDAMQAAEAALAQADVFLSIGTSGLVHPVAGFIDTAARHAALTAEINLDVTPISSQFTVTLRRRCEDVLPAVAEAVVE